MFGVPFRTAPFQWLMPVTDTLSKPREEYSNTAEKDDHLGIPKGIPKGNNNIPWNP